MCIVHEKGRRRDSGECVCKGLTYMLHLLLVSSFQTPASSSCQHTVRAMRLLLICNDCMAPCVVPMLHGSSLAGPPQARTLAWPQCRRNYGAPSPSTLGRDSLSQPFQAWVGTQTVTFLRAVLTSSAGGNKVWSDESLGLHVTLLSTAQDSAQVRVCRFASSPQECAYSA